MLDIPLAYHESSDPGLLAFGSFDSGRLNILGIVVVLGPCVGHCGNRPLEIGAGSDLVSVASRTRGLLGAMLADAEKLVESLASLLLRRSTRLLPSPPSSDDDLQEVASSMVLGRVSLAWTNSSAGGRCHEQ